MILCDTMRYKTIQYNTTRYNTTCYDTTPFLFTASLTQDYQQAALSATQPAKKHNEEVSMCEQRSSILEAVTFICYRGNHSVNYQKKV